MDIRHKLEKMLNEQGRGAKTRLANYLGVPSNYIGRWIEKPNYNVPRDKIVEIAKYFGVSVDYLLDNEQEMPITNKIPIIGKASCGVPNGYYEDDIQYIDLPAGIGSVGAYGVIADGDSMLPKIENNAIVICQKDVDIVSGDIVHYTINGESGIKRFRGTDEEIILEPLNPTYQSIRYMTTDIHDMKLSKCISVINKL